MKKLQFIAHCPKHGVIDSSVNECHITQEYVTALLFKQLDEYGFDTQHIIHEHEKIIVIIDSHQLPLSIVCHSQDQQGYVLCEISASLVEDLDWFEKIETQSIIRQLAQAVENSLKAEPNFSSYEWRG